MSLAFAEVYFVRKEVCIAVRWDVRRDEKIRARRTFGGENDGGR